MNLYEKSPNDLNDPSAGYVWSARPWASSSLSRALRDRLSWLQAHDYFSDRFCGESYINGNQVGLSAAPTIVSSIAAGDGTVTVVLARPLGDVVRELTVVLTDVGTCSVGSSHRAVSIVAAPTMNLWAGRP